MPATNSARDRGARDQREQIIGIDGGIRMSIVAAAASVPAENAAG